MTIPESISSHALERLLTVAQQYDDQQAADEIMLVLWVKSQEEALELAEAAKHDAYPAWMYDTHEEVA